MSRTAVAPHFEGAGKIVFAERNYPDPGPGQLLIGIEANAICGTDREPFYSGSEVVPGHEAAGTVLSTGKDTKVATGARGAIFLMDFCGKCRSCRLGHTNQCMAKRADMGFTQDGGYGPFELIHETNFFPIPSEVSSVDATLLLDVMGTSGHAIRRAQLVRPDIESVYIAGAGPIGLGLLVAAKLTLGDEIPVYISDFLPWRRRYATELGGLAVDAADPSALTALSDIDVAFDSTGKQTARQTSLNLLGKRGVLMCVGHGESVTLDVSADLIAPERAVLGSEYFQISEMSANLDLLLAHGDQLRRIITHTYPVSEITEAFETFFRGEAGKVIVTQEPA